MIAVCLPMLELQASAAEVSVPDGAGTWMMTIAPQEAAGESGEAIRLAAYQADTTFDGAVPEPIEPVQAELAAPGEDQPAGETTEAGEAAPLVTPAPAIDPAMYWCVYRTIPFLRTEYLANPSYRHEATMEFLFGQLRPTVIHKHYDAAPAAPALFPAPIPPYVYDVHLGHIPTFFQRYRPPAVPLGYPPRF